MIPHERRTVQGFEAHFGINHLGHFLFTHQLLGPLRASGKARVVVVSSAAMAGASLNAELVDLNWERRKFSGLRSYGDSKLMNLMFARELHRRYSAEGICANALHPGVIATELARDQSLPFMLLGLFALPMMKPVAQGAATSVMLATRPDFETGGGGYFAHCREKKPDHTLALDNEVCNRLWDISAGYVGLSPQG